PFCAPGRHLGGSRGRGEGGGGDPVQCAFVEVGGPPGDPSRRFFCPNYRSRSLPAAASQSFTDRRDLAFLPKFLHALLAGDEQSPYRILVLPIFWQTKPWEAWTPKSIRANGSSHADRCASGEPRG